MAEKAQHRISKPAHEPVVLIEASGEFTLAQAMEFGLKVIDAAREQGVRFTDPVERVEA